MIGDGDRGSAVNTYAAYSIAAFFVLGGALVLVAILLPDHLPNLIPVFLGSVT